MTTCDQFLAGKGNSHQVGRNREVKVVYFQDGRKTDEIESTLRGLLALSASGSQRLIATAVINGAAIGVCVLSSARKMSTTKTTPPNRENG